NGSAIASSEPFGERDGSTAERPHRGPQRERGGAGVGRRGAHAARQRRGASERAKAKLIFHHLALRLDDPQGSMPAFEVLEPDRVHRGPSGPSRVGFGMATQTAGEL